VNNFNQKFDFLTERTSQAFSPKTLFCHFRGRSSKRVKALRKTEFAELFVFASFGIVCLSKFRNFWKYPVFSNLQKFCKNSSEIISCFWVQKTLFLRQKQGFWGQKQGIPNIPNLQKIPDLFYSELSKN